MGKPLKTYDLASVYLLIGGYRIGGFGETGAIDFEMGGDIAESTVSGDGQVSVSRSNDKRVTATITVMETSKSYRDLGTLLAAQQATETIERLEFLMSDEINGDKVSDTHCVFLTRPTPSKSKKVGERQFKLLLPNAADTMVLGGSIAL